MSLGGLESRVWAGRSPRMAWDLWEVQDPSWGFVRSDSFLIVMLRGCLSLPLSFLGSFPEAAWGVRPPLQTKCSGGREGTVAAVPQRGTKKTGNDVQHATLLTTSSFVSKKINMLFMKHVFLLTYRFIVILDGLTKDFFLLPF